jgi:predicted nucleotidyltransferase
MGKVFQPEMIIGDQVPHPGTHQMAGQFLMDALGGRDKSLGRAVDPRLRGIPAHMIFGSVALGEANIRSDIDFLGIYEPGDLDDLEGLGDVFAETQRRYHTSIDPILYQSGSLHNTLLHSIDPSFAGHLLSIQRSRKWSRHNPLSGLFMDQTPEEVAERARPAAAHYAALKLRQFTGGIALANSNRSMHPDLEIMQRAFELPNAIGRKVLDLTVAPSDTQDRKKSRSKADTLQEIMLQTYDVANSAGFDANDIMAALNGLIAMDSDYTLLLQNTIFDMSSYTEYSIWLVEMYLPALRKAHKVSDFWSRVLTENLDEPDVEKRRGYHVPTGQMPLSSDYH